MSKLHNTHLYRSIITLFAFLLIAIIFASQAQKAESAFLIKETGQALPEQNSSFSPPSELAPFVPDEVLVKFTEDVHLRLANNQLRSVNDSQLQVLLSELQVRQYKQLFQSGSLEPVELPPTLANVYKLTLPEGSDVLLAVDRLSVLDNVEYAEPNFIYHIADISTSPPNDPNFGNQWALSSVSPFGIKADAAWDITTGSHHIGIAVIDSGYDFTHEDLESNYLGGYDLVDGDSTPQETFGHGSHVAGVAAASSNNGKGIAGVSGNSSIYAYRVCRNRTTCPIDLIAEAVNMAANNPRVWVINLSLSGPGDSPTVKSAVVDAFNKGITIVAAAGNEKSSELHYPASYMQVLGISAIRLDSALARFSNYGKWINLAAPGEFICSTVPLNYSGPHQGNCSVNNSSGYVYMEGTSQATPLVAGTAVLVYSVLPEMPRTNRTSHVVENILRTTARDLGQPGRDDRYGYGLIDAYEAVRQAANPPKLDIAILRFPKGDNQNQTANVTVRIIIPDENIALLETQARTDADGVIRGVELYGVPTGTYEVVVKGENSLSIRRTIDLVAGQTHDLDLTDSGTSIPVRGDYNGDDKINILDFSCLAKSYPGPQADMDLSGDGQLNIIDLNIFAQNYNKTGPAFFHTGKCPNQSLSSPELTSSIDQAAATLELSPSDGWQNGYQVGDVFSVDVILDSAGSSVDGSDVIVRYDPCALEVVGFIDGTIFQDYLQRAAYPERGEIEISASKPINGAGFNGSGSISQINFRVLRGGVNTGLNIFFREEDTVDSNVVDSITSAEILSGVSNKTIPLFGSPQRPAPTATLSVGESNGHITQMENPLELEILDSCGPPTAEKIDFQVYYDGSWQTIYTDMEKVDGWSATWGSYGISDQAVSVRAIVHELNGDTTTVAAGDFMLDRVAPDASLNIPSEVSSNGITRLRINSSDNLSGVNSFDIQYKVNQDGTWNDLILDTSATEIGLGNVHPGPDYYFRVRARDNAGNLSVYSEPSLMHSHFEPDDMTDMAKGITPGEPQTRSIFPIGDVDWIKINISQPTTLHLEAAGQSSDRINLTLYDKEFNQLDIHNSGNSSVSDVQATCIPEGAYYVKVNERGNDSEIYTYTLSYTATSCMSSVHKVQLPIIVR